MKAIRSIALLLLVCGACLTARAAYLHAKAELASILIRHAWKQSLQTGKPQPPWRWADTHPVARLRIPRLGYDEIVLEGATPRTLAFGPAHLLSGAGFGQPGNLVLAGHRTSWFRSLEDVKTGDAIDVEWFDADRHDYRRRYVVSTIDIVKPQDTAMLGDANDDVLTLVTCYPFGPSPTSPLRYVVRAAPQLTAQSRH
jgi:sortase A